MKMRWRVFGVMIVLFLVMFVEVHAAQVSTDVSKAFLDEKRVDVIVKLKDNVVFEEEEEQQVRLNSNEEIFSIEEKNFDEEDVNQTQVFSVDEGFAAQVSRKGLERLRNDPNVDEVYLDREVSILLYESVPLINASSVTNIRISNTNITGSSQSVCVIDTGIDYTHADFGSCTTTEFEQGNCEKVVGGYDFVNDDADPRDDHGHGTHVAGIVAGKGGVNGVSFDAKIIALKILDHQGSGVSSDLIAAIEWCTYNATKYNISVISMSLGTATLYSSNCDSVDSIMTDAINDAVLKNISVVAATGNDGSSTGIGAPSCIKNATAITSSTKSDTVSSFSNSNAITDFIAPGSSIVSTRIGGGTLTLSGTSMATPHAAGVVALLQDYYNKIYQTSATVFEIQEKLTVSGKNITDSRNLLEFPRIDSWFALALFDNEDPFGQIISPIENSVLTSLEIEINFTFTDNIGVFECFIENELVPCINTTKEFGNGNHTVTLTLLDAAKNRYDTNVSFEINQAPNITLFEPQNVTYGTNVSLPLNFSVVDSDIDSIWFVLGNQSPVFVTTNTTFNTSFSENFLTLYANDTINQVTNKTVHFRVDTIGPVINFEESTPIYVNSTNTFLVNITTDEDITGGDAQFLFANYSLHFDGISWIVKIHNAPDGNHSIQVIATDLFGNIGFSNLHYIIINTKRNESEFLEKIRDTNRDKNITSRILHEGKEVELSNVSTLLNHTIEFDFFGTLIYIADFRFVDANTSSAINVTTNLTTVSITQNFSSVGAQLNESVWIDLNDFLTGTFSPKVVFENPYQFFFYLNGTRDNPYPIQITTQCDQNITEKPCYVREDSNSTIYLNSFSGVATGSDTNTPYLYLENPKEDESFSSTQISLNYVASDNGEIDSCFYQLDNEGNTTIQNCQNTTITVAQGTHILYMYVNDTAGNVNQTNVTFSVTIEEQSNSGGGSGGSSGGGGGGGSSSSSSNAQSSSSTSDDSNTQPIEKTNEEESDVTSESVQEEEEEEEDLQCTYTIDLPPAQEISFVTNDTFTFDITYSGNCALSNLGATIAEELQNLFEVSVSTPGEISSGDIIQITIRKKGDDGVLATGSAISDLTARAVENLKGVETVNVELHLTGNVESNRVLEKNVPLNIKVVAIQRVVGPLITIGSVFGIVMVLVIVSVVVTFRKKRKSLIGIEKKKVKLSSKRK